MVLDIEIDCDGEHHSSSYGAGKINVGDNTYCEECYEHLENKIKELEEQLQSKTELIEELEQQIADAQNEG